MIDMTERRGISCETCGATFSGSGNHNALSGHIGREHPPERKPCATCMIEQPLANFPINKRGKHGRHSVCRRCRADNLVAKTADPEWVERRNRMGRDRLSDPLLRSQHRAAVRAGYARRADYYKAVHKVWKAANPDKLRAAERNLYASDPEKYKRKYRKWAASNPESRAVRMSRRRARMAAVSVTLTLAQWRAVLASYGQRCAYCGSPDRISQDHVVAIALGGAHSADNVVPACGSCNSAKRARTVDEWYGFLIRRQAS